MELMVEWTTEKGTVSFRRIPPLLKRDIDSFARDRNYPIGLAARVLLTYSLKDYQQGNLKLTPKMTQRGWTLFPETSKTGITKTRYRVVTFRGIPESIVSEIKIISEGLTVGAISARVNIGDVARAFLEHALKAYKNKKYPTNMV